MAIAGDLGRIESMLQYLHDAVMVTTAELDARRPNIVFVNQSFCKLTGYAREEIVGKSPTFLQDSNTTSEHPSTLIQELKIKQHYHGVVIRRRKDGSQYRARCQIVPILDDNGTVLYWLNIHQHIRTLADERLKPETADEPYRIIVEAQTELICQFLPDTTLTFANEPYARYLGLDRNELIGKSFIEFFGEQDKHQITSRLSGLTLKHPSRQYRLRLYGKNGGRCWYLWRFTALFDVEQQLLGYQAMGIDISECKRAEEALEVSNSHLEAILNNIPDIAWLKDSDSRFIAVNEAFAAACGLERADLVGKTDIDVWPEKLAHNYRADDREVLLAGQRKIVEERLIDRSGNETWIESIKTPILNERAQAIGTAGIARDITDRKRAEAALLEEKERALVTLHSIGDAVITTDAEGIVEYLNPIAQSLTGWTADLAKGLALGQVFQIINEETREPAADPVARCLKDGKIVGLANHSILIDRTGGEHAIEDTAAPIRGRDGQVLGAVLVFHDVSETRRMARQLAHDAAHDPLTGLPNRREFEKRLQRAVISAKKHGSRHVLCYLDLDQFKLINDTAGHAAGDELLRRVCGLMAGKFRDRDTFARLGGDEFGLLLNNCNSEEAQAICDVIVATFHNYKFDWDGRTYQIGVSIGLVPVTAEAETADELLSQADVACYTAKELGRNQFHIYQKDGAKLSPRHREIVLASGLQSALEQNRFCLHGQPIVDLLAPTGHQIRYEVLLRLRDNGGVLFPSIFIPAAERYGLMDAIDRWVIRKALGSHVELFGNDPGAVIAINLSGNSLSDESLLDFLSEQFNYFNFWPGSVCFEITETAAMRNLSKSIAILEGIKLRGCQLALDDFGSGLSSFNYLKNLPVDYLKIDGSFVQDMAVNSLDLHMVEAINEVGHTLGMKTVAEGVKDKVALRYLRDMGVDMAQGNAVSEPLPLDELPSAVHEPRF